MKLRMQLLIPFRLPLQLPFRHPCICRPLNPPRPHYNIRSTFSHKPTPLHLLRILHPLL